MLNLLKNATSKDPRLKVSHLNFETNKKRMEGDIKGMKSNVIRRLMQSEHSTMDVYSSRETNHHLWICSLKKQY